MAKKKVKKRTTKKNTGGRPTKYKPIFLKQAQVLAEKGFTDAEIAKVFEVTEKTLNNWKKEFPGFIQSLKAGKDIADNMVVQSLFRRACGYSHPEIHISTYKGVITKTNLIKHYAPDPTSCIFWLKNRDPENWRDKQETEITGKDGGPLEVNVLLTKTYKKDPDES